MKRSMIALTTLLVVASFTTADAQINARMLRYPDVSQSHIAFVYAGDIWTVPKDGGLATHLSSPEGEESFPRFSPDGSEIAFSGNYDGNTDIYIVSTTGGLPRRVTHHPNSDRVVDWYPDGKAILYASSMKSGRQRFNQFHKVPVTGGLPEKLSLPFAEFGSLSPDGTKLAFQTISRDFRTWKRYRGGTAPEIWLFDLETFDARNITQNKANDSQAMWHGDTVYFISDRDENMRYNLWAYDFNTEATRQLTFFTDFDVRFPALGPAEIVFEAGGRLHLLDLDSESVRDIEVQVVTDHASLKPSVKKVADRIENFGISPTGKRAIFEARGEVFTVPAEHGVIRNLTNSSGSAERYPSWSPDGKHVAYFSDKSGEYELILQTSDGSGEPQTLSSFGPGFRYQTYWSPDSKRLAFIDQKLDIQIFDIASRTTTKVDKAVHLTHGSLNNFRVNWSADSRWLAYHKQVDNFNNAIFLYDTQDAKVHQVTSGFFSDAQPVFDPDGKYLYLLTNRTLEPSYSDLDGSWVYINTTNVAAVPLREDVPSPLKPRNDEENTEEADSEKEDDKEGEKEVDKAKGKEAEPVNIEIANFERRLVILPPKPGNYTNLQGVSGKVIYERVPRTGSGEEKSSLVFYDLEEREEKTILKEIDSFALSADGKKILARNDRKYAIIDVKPDQKMEKPLRTSEMEMTVDPKAEWQQLYTEAWRLMRDYFYDPNMHGVDWQAMRQHYAALLQDAVTRWDIHFIIGELIAELNASHSYRFGGDTENPERRGVGLLGVNFALENGFYQFREIINGGPWDNEVRSPLLKAGIKEGEYLIAVNGVSVDVSKDPWAAFQGLAEETVVLTINDQPSIEGARHVLVETLGSESRLRNLAWIESKRKRVEEATDGRVGYIYVPNTGISGQTELVRMYRGQFNKDGLIVDERFNSGGQYPDRFIELMDRRRTGYIGFRESESFPYSPLSRTGPQVMLMNAWAGSGGDLFPYLFKEAGLGPLIGTRTWGGLIGISGAPRLIDGGIVTVPNLALYGPDGEWLIEGHGVEPDIEVVEDLTAMAQGRDNQLERAIEEILRLLKENPPVFTKKPPFDDRTAQGLKGRETTSK